jgi:DNA-nicking Smr family endonuclease
LARRKHPARGNQKKRQFANQPLAALAALQPAAPPARSPAREPAAAKAAPPNEEQLFSQAVQGVTPLGESPGELPPYPRVKPSRPVPDLEAEEVMQALRELVEGDTPLSFIETDEVIEGAVEGLDPRMLKKLRAGELSVQDHLDLHGLTWEEARQEVDRFLTSAMQHGKRCVLIVHGRGHGSKDHIPVLKNALRRWFARGSIQKRVLAFTTARPCDGGAGAVYVLLRSNRFQTSADWRAGSRS